jgi:uncharacterized protein (DUF58 family)
MLPAEVDLEVGRELSSSRPFVTGRSRFRNRLRTRPRVSLVTPVGYRPKSISKSTSKSNSRSAASFARCARWSLAEIDLEIDLEIEFEIGRELSSSRPLVTSETETE